MKHLYIFLVALFFIGCQAEPTGTQDLDALDHLGSDSSDSSFLVDDNSTDVNIMEEWEGFQVIPLNSENSFDIDGENNNTYSFNVNTTANYSIETTGLTTAENLDIYLYDDNKAFIAKAINTATDDENLIVRLDAGTYYFKIVNNGRGPTNYTLYLEDQSEQGDVSFEEVGLVDIDTGYRGFVSQTALGIEQSIYVVTNNDSNGKTQFTVLLDNYSTLGDLEIFVYNIEGTEIFNAQNSGTNTEQVTIIMEIGETYGIVVQNYEDRDEISFDLSFL